MKRVVKFINFISWYLIFSFFILFEQLFDLMFSWSDINALNLIVTILFDVVLASIIYIPGRLKIYEINNLDLVQACTTKHKTLELGNVKVLYKNPVGIVGAYKAFIAPENGKTYFIGNQYFCYNEIFI